MTVIINKTNIPTSDYGWNPVRGCYNTGCFLHPLNKGRCWAASICRRFAGPWAVNESRYVANHGGLNTNTTYKIERELYNFKPAWFESQFAKRFPSNPSMIAVGYQTDIAFTPAKWVQRIIDRIKADNQEREASGLKPHIFQFLTKDPAVYDRFEFPLNCWLGFTATTNEEAYDRVHVIWKGFSTKHMIYAYLEPLIEEIEPFWVCRLVNWVIVGGQNGPRAVPLNPDWVRKIRDMCISYKVPFYFKGPFKDLDGQTWSQFPEVK